jgi:transcription elongation GreA/GreB family factor
MSRAFVREPDGAGEGGLPERPLSQEPNYVTPFGLEQLERKVAELEERRLDLVARRGGGEIHLQDELAFLDRDLRYFTRRLKSAIPVDMSRQPRRMVAFGAAVTVTEERGERKVFRIVGEEEADPKVGKISHSSPLAKALLGARVGATVLWRRPRGNKRLTVEAIGYPDE